LPARANDITHKENYLNDDGSNSGAPTTDGTHKSTVRAATLTPLDRPTAHRVV
jgi:hypothetical protein